MTQRERELVRIPGVQWWLMQGSATRLLFEGTMLIVEVCCEAEIVAFLVHDNPSPEAFEYPLLPNLHVVRTADADFRFLIPRESDAMTTLLGAALLLGAEDPSGSAPLLRVTLPDGTAADSILALRSTLREYCIFTEDTGATTPLQVAYGRDLLDTARFAGVDSLSRTQALKTGSSLLYGELLPAGVTAALAAIGGSPRVVYDLGMGVGKIVVQLFTDDTLPCEHVVGIELCSERYARAEAAVRSLVMTTPALQLESRSEDAMVCTRSAVSRLELRRGDFTLCCAGIEQADVVFVNVALTPERGASRDSRAAIHALLLRHLRNGCAVISLDDLTTGAADATDAVASSDCNCRDNLANPGSLVDMFPSASTPALEVSWLPDSGCQFHMYRMKRASSTLT